MAHNLIDYKLAKRQMNDMVALNPYHIQNWVLKSASDGFGTGNSYTFGDSYVGLLAAQGRQIFRDLVGSDTASASFKDFVISVPYDASKSVPTRNSMVILYDMNGRSQGRFYVLFVQVFTADTSGVNQDTAWKWEAVVQRWE